MIKMVLKKCKDHPITLRMNQLYKRRKPDLKEIIKRSHRIIDLKGTSKGLLVAIILEDEFGVRKIDAWNKECFR